MLHNTSRILSFFILTSLFSLIRATFNLTLPHQHPNPEAVVNEVQRRLNVSISRRQMQTTPGTNPQCLTGNPIDDCWRCDPDWANNRQRLADCGIGFGQAAIGGKGGPIYVVTDSSDNDAANPAPGTLRHAVIQDGPMWIVFSADMFIKLKHELMVSSYKTIDGRGTNVRVTGNGCITLHYVSNVIIHNVHIYNCLPSGNAIIMYSPTHAGKRGKSDGDGVSIFSSRSIWIDHCSLSRCTDGLIDATMGSTAITISNCHFTHHDKVTLAFNHFGEGLVQRMPRCRHGYIHVVNNDFTEWQMYAIGGSANPTINSEGNRYIAPIDHNSKEVTKRVDTDQREWAGWNWRTNRDMMVNGAFFVPSGEEMISQYAKASSVQPQSAALIDQLTLNSGVFGDPRDNGVSISFEGGSNTEGSTSGNNGGDGNNFGMIFQSSALSAIQPVLTTRVILSCTIILNLLITTNHGSTL